MGIPATLNLGKAVGPDAEVVTNANGGHQAHCAFAFHLIPPLAKFALAEVLKQGADKHGANNWRDIPIADHLDHMEQHSTAFIYNDTSEGPSVVHLVHAFARLAFALELALLEEVKAHRVTQGFNYDLLASDEELNERGM